MWRCGGLVLEYLNNDAVSGQLDSQAAASGAAAHEAARGLECCRAAAERL